jgi:hypothetical protein
MLAGWLRHGRIQDRIVFKDGWTVQTDWLTEARKVVATNGYGYVGYEGELPDAQASEPAPEGADDDDRLRNA